MLLSLRYLVGTVVVLTGLMMAAKRYVDVNICVPIQRRGKDAGKAKKKKKKKGSLGDSLSVLKSSPMILNLALLVVSYGVSHRLFEFAWKGQLRALYPSAQAYQVSSMFTPASTIPLKAGKCASAIPTQWTVQSSYKPCTGCPRTACNGIRSST